MAHLTPNAICKSCGEYEKDCACNDLRLQIDRLQSELKAQKTITSTARVHLQAHRAAGNKWLEYEEITEKKIAHQAAELEQVNAENEELKKETTSGTTKRLMRTIIKHNREIKRLRRMLLKTNTQNDEIFNWGADKPERSE